VTYDAWRPYGGVESCMNTLCAGYTITAHFVPATDPDTPDEGVLYRIYPPGGNAYRIFDWGAEIECTRCFHLPGMPGPPVTPPAPVVIAAVDWLGHESDERIIVDFPPPPSCAELLALLDAGPPDASLPDAPLPDARPPDAPLALPDAPASSPTGSVACGCAAAGPAGGLGPALLVAAFLVRRPPSARDAQKKGPRRVAGGLSMA
jgi:MYXO-CTERM domain-containing protein